MAKAGRKPKQTDAAAKAGAAPKTDRGQAGKKGGKAQARGESISGYFRKVFKENSKLLKSRSNEELLRRWLADHPGETAVPERVRQGLSNVKSVLRSRRRKRGGSTKEASAPAKLGWTGPPAPASSQMKLETLEERIDDCLMMARMMGEEGLTDVIQHLRRARNGIVWRLGE